MAAVEEIALQQTKLYFMSNKKRFTLLHDLLTKKHKVSLRLLEYAVHNAARVTKNINLHGLSLEMLSLYGKRRLDAFKRHRAFVLSAFGMSVESNLAQLRFLRFGHRIGVIDRLINDKEYVMELEEKMNDGQNTKCTDVAVGVQVREEDAFLFFKPLTDKKDERVEGTRCFD